MKPSKRTRRAHSPEFKAKLISECLKPGASIAAIAMSHQINDNLLRSWMRQASGTSATTQANPPEEPPQRLVPVKLATPIEPMPVIRIHIQQPNTQIHLEWPLSHAHLCSDWLRGFLR